MKIATSKPKWQITFDSSKETSTTKNPTRFMVEHNFSHGWDDAGWTTTKRGKSTTQTFPSRIEAMNEITGHIKACKEDFKKGNMDDAPKVKDFRVVPLIKHG